MLFYWKFWIGSLENLLKSVEEVEDERIKKVYEHGPLVCLHTWAHAFFYVFAMGLVMNMALKVLTLELICYSGPILMIDTIFLLLIKLFLVYKMVSLNCVWCVSYTGFNISIGTGNPLQKPGILLYMFLEMHVASFLNVKQSLNITLDWNHTSCRPHCVLIFLLIWFLSRHLTLYFRSHRWPKIYHRSLTTMVIL